MLEYAFAKQSSETYADYLRKMTELTVINPRFPRVKTEQTLSLLDIPAVYPEEILLKVFEQNNIFNYLIKK